MFKIARNNEACNYFNVQVGSGTINMLAMRWAINADLYFMMSILWAL
jgi:hypothetical protein